MNKQNYVINPKNNPYFIALDLTKPKGTVKKNGKAKFEQVQKAVFYLDQAVSKSALTKKVNKKAKKEISVIDMGCGKGYLTFAIYDYFNNLKKVPTEVIGVDQNKRLIKQANGLAKKIGYDKLKFKVGTISDFQIKKADVLVALHACNTATDEALAKGIRANAEILLVVPCCHQEIEDQLGYAPLLHPIFKHKLFASNYSQMITDALRGLILEIKGYTVTIFDFVPESRTHKNVMIRAVKHDRGVDTDKLRKQYEELKDEFAIKKFSLEDLLG